MEDFGGHFCPKCNELLIAIGTTLNFQTLNYSSFTVILSHLENSAVLKMSETE